MESVLLILASALLGGLWLGLLLTAEGCVKIYRRLRTPCVVICPVDHAPAALDLLSTPPPALSNRRVPHLCVRGCSRWPEHAGCDQACVRRIEDVPLRRAA
jgi:hypothetical protein